MEDAVGVRKLLELIFVKKSLITAEMTATDSSFPACMLIDDFSEKLRHIFLLRHAIGRLKWKKHLENYSLNTLSTPLGYLDFILSTCFNEHYCHPNMFDSFLSVCSILKYFSHLTLVQKGMNYCDLNFDIMMEFYESVLKEPFRRCGGFHRLVEYIHQHKYLAWKLGKTDVSSVDATSPPVKTDLVEKLKKELFTEKNTFNSVQFKSREIRASINFMAQRIISTTSVDLATLPRDHDSNQTEGASRLSDEAKTPEVVRRIEADLKLEPSEEVFQGCSNSDSKSNQVAKQNEGIAWYDSIVQAVIRYNRLKTSNLGTSDDRLKKAEEILEHLKDTIKSLINILDKYDEE